MRQYSRETFFTDLQWEAETASGYIPLWPGSRAAHPSEPLRQRDGCYWTRLSMLICVERRFSRRPAPEFGHHIASVSHEASPFKEVKMCCFVLKGDFFPRVTFERTEDGTNLHKSLVWHIGVQKAKLQQNSPHPCHGH